MAQSFSRSREDDHSKPAIIGINLTFMLLSIAGNLLVIFSVSRTPSLRSPSTTLLCGLAASDVIVGLIAQPLFIIRELIPNDTLFHMVFLFSCNGCGVSLLTMTLISLDRYAISLDLDVGACKQQGAQQLHESGRYFNSLHVQISYFCGTLEMQKGYIATFKYSV